MAEVRENMALFIDGDCEVQFNVANRPWGNWKGYSGVKGVDSIIYRTRL